MANTVDVTLEQKIGQMLLIGFEGKNLQQDTAVANDIAAQRIGGVILFDYNYKTKTFDKNIANPEQLQQLTTQLNKHAVKAAGKNNNDLFPLFIGIDYEGGRVNRLKPEYGFPETLSAAAVAKLSITQARDYAQQMAKTLKTNGINLDFAPVLDVNVNPSNPVIGGIERSFSNDPNVVSSNALLFAQQFNAHNILCSYKHFPGHGSSTKDSHKGFVDVTDTWQEYELLPYQKLFSQMDGCDLVMTAHIVNKKLDATALPASLSHAITTTLLREQLGFQGIVVTDDLQMKAISEHYSLSETVTLAINAGADILVFGNQLAPQNQDPQQIIDIVKQKIQDGEIDQARIEESYKKILALKHKLRARLLEFN